MRRWVWNNVKDTFEVQAAMDAEQEILDTHQIPKRWVISEPNPNYKFG